MEKNTILKNIAEAKENLLSLKKRVLELEEHVEDCFESKKLLKYEKLLDKSGDE
ncbi:hypothetical protein HN709_03060 [Candidatus Peregrinibacteria bacterium]|jgi:hypothetical protein|nr:hypothetical protein [Candidatus Peregrinibacteria bacterium]MBT7736643.1 hypothetical protein [Candidatus Peregrinibacteria bacterium]